MEKPQIKSAEEISPVTPDWLNDAESERLVASMEFWYPYLEEVEGIKTPKTAWVALEPSIIKEGTIHELHWAEFDNDEFREAVKQVGGPPAFLRTDQASDIYNMEASSKVDNLSTKEIEETANGLISFNVQQAEVPFSSFVVREWLDVKHLFTAWGGKKIGVEIRTFVSEGNVESWGFDWPKKKLQADSEDWDGLYKQTKELAEDKADEVIPMAKRVAQRFEGVGPRSWSVDFVLAENGEWYCTDMAPKQMSQVPDEIHEI